MLRLQMRGVRKLFLVALAISPDLLSDANPRGARGSFMNDAYPCGPGQICNLLPFVSGSGYIGHLWTCGDAQSAIQVYVNDESTPDSSCLRQLGT